MLRLDLNLLWTVCNLIIWYLLIRKFLFKPINDIINKREALLQSRYEEAQELQNTANAEKEKYQASQAQIADERARVLAAAQEDARAEYDQILKEAQKKADKIVDDSKKEAAIEKEKILSKAESEIRSLIMDTAVNSMQSANHDSELYDQFLLKAGETTDAE